MGATGWRDNILQALFIGLVVHIVVSILWVFWTSLWAAWKERMGRPVQGESMVESDLEMGTVNVDEDATIPDLTTNNPPYSFAANSGVGDDDKLDYSESKADTRATTREIPTVSESSTQGPLQERH